MWEEKKYFPLAAMVTIRRTGSNSSRGPKPLFFVVGRCVSASVLQAPASRLSPTKKRWFVVLPLSLSCAAAT